MINKQIAFTPIFILRKKHPDAKRLYKAFRYPVLYILMGLAFCGLLFIYKPRFTWPGLVITLSGIPVYYLANRKQRGRQSPVSRRKKNTTTN